MCDSPHWNQQQTGHYKIMDRRNVRKRAVKKVNVMLTSFGSHLGENDFGAAVQDDEITSSNIQSVAGGTYHYFGILKALSKTMERIWSVVLEKYEFELQLNMDVLPLFKSSSL